MCMCESVSQTLKRMASRSGSKRRHSFQKFNLYHDFDRRLKWHEHGMRRDYHDVGRRAMEMKVHGRKKA